MTRPLSRGMNYQREAADLGMAGLVLKPKTSVTRDRRVMANEHLVSIRIRMCVRDE